MKDSPQSAELYKIPMYRDIDRWRDGWLIESYFPFYILQFPLLKYWESDIITKRVKLWEKQMNQLFSSRQDTNTACLDPGCWKVSSGSQTNWDRIKLWI